MEHLAEILKLIEGGIARDPDKVNSYAELLAAKLRLAGDEGAARRVARAINARAATLHPADLASIGSIPVDGEARVPLADVSYPSLDDCRLVLPDSVSAAIDDYILGYQQVGDLLAAGLNSPGHLLLYGPPGCGKTQTAAFVAASLDLPLITARLDGLVSSYLGSTAKNVRALFEFVDRRPCVLLLDEFDAVAKMRDDPNELGELKRVVNSLLQNIDLLPSGTAVVAATNHAQLLDPAVWRRFEIHLEVPLPNREARVRLFQLYSHGVSDDVNPELLARLTAGCSAADIRSACDFTRRELVLHRDAYEGQVAGVRLLLRYLSRTREHGANPGSTLEDQIQYLRNADPAAFSYATISRLLGVSKGKISKVLATGGSTSDG